MANEDIMATLERVELRLEKVESKVDGVEQKVGGIEQKVNRLELMLEKVGDDIKKLGEGYEDGMRRISKEIKDLNKQWTSKWSPHDLAIRNHGKRITVIEQRRPRRG